ncbi:AraC family transcriptional regulator [Lacticaseibacillus kribbianus]|uniref:AraC family transcriptional regulator n=1 Tax=Lacticaseibacillus kribbianus TaxID=2926292 RepID=UPI001CD79CF4|nr:AraC family transcriptional regulator [Lacticaseibacillus kribbianus]
MIRFEQVEQWPTLPFKFFQHKAGTPITVAPHWHPEVELNFLVAGGPLRFVAGETVTTYRPGDYWAVDRRVSHEADGDNTLEWDEFGFIISEAFLQGKLPQSADWQLTLSGRASEAVAPAAYRALFAEAQAMRSLIRPTLDADDRLLVLSHFYRLLVLLDRHFAAHQRSAVALNPGLVDAVIDRIHRGYAGDLTVAALAAGAHVSQTTLNQQFQDAMGMTVHDYLTQVRVIAAKRLLVESTAGIDYIASVCGFGSVKTFQRNFRHLVHRTPSAFRAAPFAADDADCLE